MLKNIYSPLSGAIAQERVLETIANNMANMNTVGFKGDRVSFTLLEAEPEKNYNSPLPPANYKVDVEQLMNIRGNEMAYVGIADVMRDETQGPAIATGNPTDIMIEGEGLLGVNTPDGMRYTRNGSLSVSREVCCRIKTACRSWAKKGTSLSAQEPLRSTMPAKSGKTNTSLIDCNSLRQRTVLAWNASATTCFTIQASQKAYH